MPRVSIGLPVYNGELFVQNAIESILNQSFTDLELIICDNGSSDRTPEIARTFAERDPRVRFYRSEENRGAAWNFNHVFELANGEYFKWAAADDVCTPDYLMRCVEVLDGDPETILCHSRTGQIDAEGRRVGDYEFTMRLDSPEVTERFHDLIVVRHDCYAVFGLVRAEVLRRTSLIGSYVGSDRVLLAELSLLGKLYEIPEVLFLRRKHRENSVCLDERGERLAWFDPNLAGKISYPNWRILREYLRIVNRTPQKLPDRLRCYGQIGSHVRVRSRFLRRDVTEAIKKRLSRSRAGQRVLVAIRHVSQTISS
jgi:glycosyltransferase involved in cell wall biosynthesis